MIRVLEIALFLAPFALFAAWRLLAPGTAIGPRHIAVAALVLAASLALLVWLRLEDAEPAGTTYVPARLRNGVIEPPAARP